MEPIRSPYSRAKKSQDSIHSTQPSDSIGWMSGVGSVLRCDSESPDPAICYPDPTHQDLTTWWWVHTPPQPHAPGSSHEWPQPRGQGHILSGQVQKFSSRGVAINTTNVSCCQISRPLGRTLWVLSGPWARTWAPLVHAICPMQLLDHHSQFSISFHT